ncbi:nucleoside triphosphate pyrophosphohydrolase family protein [Halomonas sp. H10-59]|uniref:Nucleoside triphosphate pyrophosphohydrolase family protein n=1 Tax=Halomonas sp. H10-59 TaxID=2950874 RepID=A0AAU7KR05_9GAMM
MFKDNLGRSVNTASLERYEKLVAKTDKFSMGVLKPILLGLYGEVGSIMSAAKKYHREKKAYVGYKDAVEEEFGDALWYFVALCRRMDLKVPCVFAMHMPQKPNECTELKNQNGASPSKNTTLLYEGGLDASLLRLGRVTADLLNIDKSSSNIDSFFSEFLSSYFQSMSLVGLCFSDVLEKNIEKVSGRFLVTAKELLPDFDASFPEEEQLPRKFEIQITQRKSGQCYLRWNGVFIGSPLTDNIKDPDGYRFHDVLHLAHAAILHWSPTFRALIKQKRKSDRMFDEAQDSGRAIVVEEGLTAWLYSCSKRLDYFEGHDGISYDILKTIQRFVQGYEVEKCPLKLWEDAILQGYAVFRKVRENDGGIVIGDREKRTLLYRSFGDACER